MTDGSMRRSAAVSTPSLAPTPHGRLLATMSHELRTPLNVVIGFSEAMMRESGGALTREQVAEYAGSINEAGRQLLTLVDVILDVARVEAGQFELPSDLIQIDHMVSAVVAHYTDAAAAADLRLEGVTPSGLPLLRGDERRVRKALDHIVGNAIKFTPGGGSIRLTARLEEQSGDLLLMVSDTGIGVQESDIQRAFEPFVQLDASLARRFSGTGLGLYVSRTTARAHGGDLILSSEPGIGTTAVLQLPASRLVTPPAHLLT